MQSWLRSCTCTTRGSRRRQRRRRPARQTSAALAAAAATAADEPAWGEAEEGSASETQGDSSASEEEAHGGTSGAEGQEDKVLAPAGAPPAADCTFCLSDQRLQSVLARCPNVKQALLVLLKLVHTNQVAAPAATSGPP